MILPSIPCPTCQKPANNKYCFQTNLGYFSPPGHNHDDNCITAEYVCPGGHHHTISPRRKCNAEGCDWKGKETCFCHKGTKVEI